MLRGEREATMRRLERQIEENVRKMSGAKAMSGWYRQLAQESREMRAYLMELVQGRS